MSTYQIVTKEIVLVFDSSGLGSTNIDPLKPGSESIFNVQFDEPLTIPTDAIDPILEVQEAIIFNTNPNLVNGSTFQIDSITPYIIPPGNWGTQELESEMNSIANLPKVQIVAGGDFVPAIQITGIDAQNKVRVTFNTQKLGGTTPTPSQTLKLGSELLEIIGFDPSQDTITVPAGGGSKSETGNNQAEIQALNYYLIASDIVADGIRFNNDYQQIIAQVAIDANPGSAIIYRPMIPATMPVDELIGATRSSIQMRLLKNNLTLANTGGESWNVRVAIRYKLMVHLDVTNPNPMKKVD